MPKRQREIEITVSDGRISESLSGDGACDREASAYNEIVKDDEKGGIAHV